MERREPAKDFGNNEDNEGNNWENRDLAKLPTQKKKLPPILNPLVASSLPYQNIELSNTELSTKELVVKSANSLPSKFELLMKESNVVEVFDLTKGI